MRKYCLTSGLVLLLVITSNAAKVEGRGREWLDAQKDPPAVNVSGAWDSEDWGVLHLTQVQGSRDVSGNGYGYNLTGVVSGKRLFLLFHSRGGSVAYCASFSSDADNILTGSYSYRVTRWRFGHGLCQEKSYPMHMTKR